MSCGWLSFVVVVGLVAQLLICVWRLDSIASLAIVWLLAKEGREAWRVKSQTATGRYFLDRNEEV